MRVFNPFKPHICEFATGGYAVRKLTIVGWGYLDRQDKYWWLLGEYAHYTVYVNPIDAVERLQQYVKKQPKFSKLYAY